MATLVGGANDDVLLGDGGPLPGGEEDDVNGGEAPNLIVEMDTDGDGFADAARDRKPVLRRLRAVNPRPARALEPWVGLA